MAKIVYQNNIFSNYEANKTLLDLLFEKVKNSLQEVEETKRINIQASIERLIDLLRECRDEGKAQVIWNEIKKELIKKDSVSGTISTIAALLNM